MASATCLSPFCVGAVHQVRPVRERRHERNGEPITCRLAETGLVLDVVRQVAERIKLGLAAVVSYFFVASGVVNGLEDEENECHGFVYSDLQYPTPPPLVYTV